MVFRSFLLVYPFESGENSKMLEPMLITLFILGTAAFIFITIGFYVEYGCFWWSATASAFRVRQAKWHRYVREYLGYGFSMSDSASKATARMNNEAMATEDVLK